MEDLIKAYKKAWSVFTKYDMTNKELLKMMQTFHRIKVRTLGEKIKTEDALILLGKMSKEIMKMDKNGK